MKRYLFLLPLLALPAFAVQVFRVDPAPVMTTAGNAPAGGFPALYAVAGASINICTDAACSLPATTYADATGNTACPLTAPVVLAGTSLCAPTTGPQGQFGFWLTAGTFYYRVTFPTGQSFGTFPITGPSPGVTNVTAGTGISVSNGGVGSVTVTNTGVISFNGRTGAVVPTTGDHTYSQIGGPVQGNTTKPQMAGTNSGAAAAALCNDASGNATTSGCAASTVLPSGTQTQYLQIQPNTGNSTTYRFANLPVAVNVDYNFPAQTCNGSLVCTAGGSSGGVLGIGNNSITMTPVPIGLNGSDANHTVYVSGGVGTAESCAINGGAGTSGQSPSGVIIINCANTHSGAFTIATSTGGIREASISLGGPGKVTVTAAQISIHGAINKPVQVWIEGSGMQATILNVASDFPLAALGVFIVDDTGDPVRAGPTGGVSDLSVSFIQPDSTSLAAYTHWPPAFYLYNTDGPIIARVVAYRAWDFVKAIDGGAATFYDVKASFFHRGFDVDNILDTFRVEDFHSTVYGLTTNQYGIFWNNAAIYALWLGNINDGQFKSVTSISGKFLNSHQGARGVGTGLDGWLAFEDIDVDTNGGFEVDGGQLRVVNGYFSVGGVTGTVLAAQPAITQTGGMLQCVNCKFSANAQSTGPMISLNFQRDVNTGALYAPTFTMSNSIVEQTVVDQSAIVATESSAYTNVGTVTIAGNNFIKAAGGNLSNAVISISDGTGAIEATITGNHFTDKLSGTGSAIVLSGDHYHAVTGNAARGWSFSIAGTALTTFEGNAGFSSNRDTTPAYRASVGTATVASAATITPTGQLFQVSGTVTISTINLPYTGFEGTVCTIPTALWATNTAGNIGFASTAVVAKTLCFTYIASLTKWYPSY